MTPADALHAGLINPWATVFVAFTTVVGAALGWGLAALVVGPRARWGRAARAVGLGGFALLGLVVVVRGIATWRFGSAGGPLGWLGGIGAPTGGWLGLDLAVLLGFLYAVALVPAAGLGAMLTGRWPARRWQFPEPELAGGALLLAAPVAWWLAWAPLGQQATPLFGLDLLAALPAICAAFAVGTRSWDLGDAPRAVQAPPPVEDGVPASGPVPIWRAMGAIGASERPFATRPAVAEDQAPPSAQAVWRAAGGGGQAPRALDEIADRLAEPDRGWLVGDVPLPTDRALVAAAVLHAANSGIRVVLVTDDDRLAGTVRVAFEAMEGWSPGPIVQGVTELRESFARRLLPTVAILGVGELSAEGIGILSRDRTGTGLLWSGSVGLVAMPRVDRGSPLTTTHRTLALRRLSLALADAGARWSLLATGFGGRGTLRLLERAFPHVEIRRVPLRPRQTAPVAVWLARHAFQQAPGDPWTRLATEAPARAGLVVRVSDPTGSLDRRDVEVWDGDVELVRDVTLGGDASVAILDDRWLVATWRTLRHLTPRQDGAPHHALWGLIDDPVTRFLARDGNLDGLLDRGLLAPPEPLVGVANRAVGRAHLQAALRDGEHDVASLSAAFGASLVEELVQGTPGDRWRTRSGPGGRPIRSQVVPRRGDPVRQAIRPTVTDRTMRILDRESGQDLGEVDALTAATRLYPRRVLAIAGRRYEVPLHAHDAKRDTIAVTLVEAGRRVTSPLLETQARSKGLLEAHQDVRRDGLAFRLALFDVLVAEAVRGVRRGPDDVVRYEPVTARYRSKARGIFFRSAHHDDALHHLARSLDGVLRTHLLASDDDLDAVSVAEGFHPGFPAGVLVIDRHVQGMGLGEALDEHLVEEALGWVRGILFGCGCTRGCRACTPVEVLEARRADKQGVLRLLGAAAR